MKKAGFKTLEMTRRIRDAHYERLKDKSQQERLAFYRRKTRSLHAEMSKQASSRMASQG